MLLLRSTDPQAPPRTWALFGLGLIGAAVARALAAAAPQRSETQPLDWNDADRQAAQLDAIATRIESWLMEASDGRELRILWCAGRAGFAATEAETDAELASFRRVLQTIERVRDRTGCGGHFVHLSSAGGLYEGQRFVEPHSPASPRRPYGVLKLRQEESLAASDVGTKCVYRLTSAYGYVRSGQRRGLIPTLVWSGLRRKVCFIHGHVTTLRDFVWVEDVARFLAEALLEEPVAAKDSVSVIGSGKPSSILEVQWLVERTLNRKLYVTYVPQPSNGADITVSPRALAPGWRTSDMALNVRRIYSDALTRGTTFDPARE